MKYIDADRLRAEIERLKNYAEESKKEWSEEGYNQNAFAEDCRIKSFDKPISFIDSLPQEQPEPPKIEITEYYYQKGVYEGLSQGRADALKILEEFMKRKADPVIVIKQQEQPEVDLEKEIKDTCRGYRINDYHEQELGKHDIENIARHFAEWGAEQFARIVRANLTKIDKSVQSQFERLYIDLTGNKMYGGYND